MVSLAASVGWSGLSPCAMSQYVCDCMHDDVSDECSIRRDNRL